MLPKGGGTPVETFPLSALPGMADGLWDSRKHRVCAHPHIPLAVMAAAS